MSKCSSKSLLPLGVRSKEAKMLRLSNRFVQSISIIASLRLAAAALRLLLILVAEESDMSTCFQFFFQKHREGFFFRKLLANLHLLSCSCILRLANLHLLTRLC